MKIQIVDYSDATFRVTIEDEQGSLRTGFVASIPEVLRAVEKGLRSLPQPDRRSAYCGSSPT